MLCTNGAITPPCGDTKAPFFHAQKEVYPKRFTTCEIPPQPETQPDPPMPPQGVEVADVQTSDFPTSRSRDYRRADVDEADASYNM